MQPNKLIFHGAAKEIGKSCIEAVFVDNTRILLDAGQKNLSPETSVDDVYLTSVKDLAEVSAVFVTHAHLDHCGSLPYLVKHGLNCSIYCSPVTASIMQVMFKDALRIGEQKGESQFGKEDVKKTLQLMRVKEVIGVVGTVSFQMHPVGHIPGAMGVFLETAGKSLFYTGDFTCHDSRLTTGCVSRQLTQADILITEATYGARKHKSQKIVEERIKDWVKKVIGRGGHVIIPSLATAKTQELTMILDDLFRENFYYRRCIDGMGRAVTEAMLKHPEALRDPNALNLAYNCSALIDSWSRKQANRGDRESVFIATNGMMSGGPVIDYVRDHSGDKKNLIIIPSFQAPGTPGRELLDTGWITLGENERIKPKCRVVRANLSTHADRSDQIKMIKGVRPKTVIVQHGDPDSCEAVAVLAQEMGCETIVPRVGETIEF